MNVSTESASEIRSPKSVVEEYWARLHRRDEAALDLVAEDFVNHAAAPQGRAGMRQIALVLDHDLGSPDIRIHHVVASGDLVVVHLDLWSGPTPGRLLRC